MQHKECWGDNEAVVALNEAEVPLDPDTQIVEPTAVQRTAQDSGSCCGCSCQRRLAFDLLPPPVPDPPTDITDADVVVVVGTDTDC